MLRKRVTTLGSIYTSHPGSAVMVWTVHQQGAVSSFHSAEPEIGLQEPRTKMQGI